MGPECLADLGVCGRQCGIVVGDRWGQLEDCRGLKTDPVSGPIY